MYVGSCLYVTWYELDIAVIESVQQERVELVLQIKK